MEGDTVIAPAFSTTQGEEFFDLGRYDDSAKDRREYLGQNVTDREELLQSLKEYYMVNEMVEFLNGNPQYKKITLQFPDLLVKDSALVVQLLQEQLCDGKAENLELPVTCCSGSGCQSSSKTCCKAEDYQTAGRLLWILADTAYSSCCVDEVASGHVNGDLVIHFGDACLNAVQKVPALYCFGRPFSDVQNQAAKFQETFPDKDSKVVLMANAPHTYHLKELYQTLQNVGYQNILFSDINRSFAGDNAYFLTSPDYSDFNVVYTLDNRKLLSSSANLIQDDETLQQEYDLFHITQPDDPRLLFLTTKFKSVSIYDTSDNTVSQGPYPSMMKRYKFMHMARTAGTIGLLVNTLSLKNTKETINRLAEVIKSNGKKHYMFVVGKPNVAKLANFEPIDIWCILGCGQSGIILDQFNDFYKPIITPYELIMALNPEVTWTGQWVVDFKKVLEELGDENESETIDDDTENYESEAPEFNAVSGQYVSTSRPLRNLKHINVSASSPEEENESNQLVKKFSGAVAIGNTLSTSAMHLQSRQWSGLGSDFAADNYEEDGATLEQGGSGIASQYEFDRDNKV